MLQKIEVSLQQLVGRPTISNEHLNWATDQVNLFFGSFRKADADDPKTFTAGCLRLFTAYDSEVVRYVVDPLTGLPGSTVWLPALSEVKTALDNRSASLLKQVQQARIEAENLRERRKWQASRKNRPTLDELKAKHGEGWGLPTLAKEGEKAKADRLARLSEANERLLKQEREAAGMSSASPISPSLAALMKAGTA